MTPLASHLFSSTDRINAALEIAVAHHPPAVGTLRVCEATEDERNAFADRRINSFGSIIVNALLTQRHAESTTLIGLGKALIRCEANVAASCILKGYKTQTIKSLAKLLQLVISSDKFAVSNRSLRKTSTNRSLMRLVYVLSPAKTLDLSPSRLSQCTQPRLLSDAHELVEQLRSLSQSKIKSLLHVSDGLAKLNFDRFQVFDTSKTATEASSPRDTLKQAALAFNGPAYQGLDAHNLSDSDLKFAQTHLRILCGLYGILRPLDLIQPYRLEMGQKFSNSRGKDLYEFWGDALVSELNALFTEQETEEGVKRERVLVNVASQEYFKSLPRVALEAAGISVIDCVFQDDGRIKSVYAKRARGLMCRYLIQKRVDSLVGLMGFDLEGYKYSSTASKDSTYVFTRTAAEQKLALQQIKAKSSSKGNREGDETVKTSHSQSVAEVRMENDRDGSILRRSSRKKQKTS